MGGVYVYILWEFGLLSDGDRCYFLNSRGGFFDS
jgi:hypothetical protein